MSRLIKEIAKVAFGNDAALKFFVLSIKGQKIEEITVDEDSVSEHLVLYHAPCVKVAASKEDAERWGYEEAERAFKEAAREGYEFHVIAYEVEFGAQAFISEADIVDGEERCAVQIMFRMLTPSHPATSEWINDKAQSGEHL